ncbi:hypothetical protein AGLY_013644, partial [Aphis glycines]
HQTLDKILKLDNKQYKLIIITLLNFALLLLSFIYELFYFVFIPCYNFSCILCLIIVTSIFQSSNISITSMGSGLITAVDRDSNSLNIPFPLVDDIRLNNIIDSGSWLSLFIISTSTDDNTINGTKNNLAASNVPSDKLDSPRNTKPASIQLNFNYPKQYVEAKKLSTAPFFKVLNNGRSSKLFVNDV